MAPSNERIILDLRGAEPGPTLIVTAGVHGNEAAGVTAARQVGERLASCAALRGRWVALQGNVQALAAGRRYVDRDLNRGWSPAALVRLLESEADGTAEDQEQRALFKAQLEIIGSSSADVIFVDLHTTSGSSDPFVCFGDTPQNRQLARYLPMTAIVGLDEVIDGAMLKYWADRGYAAVSIEGGQHADPRTVERHVAALWICLTAVGALRAEDVPELVRHRALLEAASQGRPRCVEVVHRHVVADGDAFEMLPGFASFDPVREGQLLGRDRRGDVVASREGLLLMPRYQGQGEDGFFLARELLDANA